MVSDSIPGGYQLDPQLVTPRSRGPPPGLTRAAPEQFKSTWASLDAATEALTKLNIQAEPFQGQSTSAPPFAPLVPPLALPGSNSAPDMRHLNTGNNGAWARGPPGRATPRGSQSARRGGSGAVWNSIDLGNASRRGGMTPRLNLSREGGGGGSATAVNSYIDDNNRYRSGASSNSNQAPARTPRGPVPKVPPPPPPPPPPAGYRREPQGLRDAWED